MSAKVPALTCGRQYKSLLQELKALKRRYRSDDSSNASSDGLHGFRRLELDLLGRLAATPNTLHCFTRLSLPSCSFMQLSLNP